MNFASVEQIAEAVLYEGYVLYPYRPSSVKNRQRWTFGGLYPRDYSVARGSVEPWSMQTECLVLGDPQTVLAIRVRFLHIMQREVRELQAPASELPADIEKASRPVEALAVGDKLYQTWQEATEREADSVEIELSRLLDEPLIVPFAFPASRTMEAIRAADGPVVGSLLREQHAVNGVVRLSAAAHGDDLFKIVVGIENLTSWDNAGPDERAKSEQALRLSLASTHTILGVRGGEFVSLLDPPERFSKIAAACQNVGTYPVLAGAEGQRDMMLSSPIILYDYPQIAPESPGNLFDGTEIDEILTLRILTLTEDEKREMRAVDDRARDLLERSEALTGEQLMLLHGTMRYPMLSREDEADG